MEIRAWLFISFWGVMSFTSLHLGFRALDETQLSHSVSPIVMLFFKHSLALSSCFSSNYALRFRAQPRHAVRSHYVLLLYGFFSYIIVPQTGIIEDILYIFLIAPFAWVPYIPYFNFVCKCLSVLSIFEILGLLCILAYHVFLACKNNFSELKTRSGILLALEISLSFAGGRKKKTDFSPLLALSISHFISMTWAALPRFGDYTIVAGNTDSGYEGLVNAGVRFVAVKMEAVVSMLKNHKAKKFVEFAVGTVGAILFQNFFRITSFGEVAAFLYFAVTWVANLVMLGFWGDVGVFNFLLANVVVGCTVGQFGLHGATWAALGAALLLFALRLKLESLHLVYGEGQRIQLSFLDHEFVADVKRANPSGFGLALSGFGLIGLD